MSRDERHIVLDQYLAMCVRAALGGEPLPPWPFASIGAMAALGLAPDDEPGFTRDIPARLEFHGIAVLLGTAEGGLAGWSEPAEHALRSLMRRGALEEQVTRAAVVDLIEALARRGARAIAMKGCALAYGYYPLPQMRPRGDTDLLVREDDLAIVRGVLAELGWDRPDNPHGIYYQEIWRRSCGPGLAVTVDLHWRASDRPVIQQLLRAEEFWAHARPLPGLCPHALAPAPVHLLLHGAVNQTWHERFGFFATGQRYRAVRRLIWAADYHRIAARCDALDWDLLVQLGAERGAGAILHKVLTGAIADAGVRVPDRILDRLAATPGPSALDRYVHAASLQQMWRDDLMATPGLAGRLRFVGLSARATRAQLLEKYPGAARWPTFLLRIRWIAAAAVRLVSGRSSAAR